MEVGSITDEPRFTGAEYISAEPVMCGRSKDFPGQIPHHVSVTRWVGELVLLDGLDHLIHFASHSLFHNDAPLFVEIDWFCRMAAARMVK